MSLQFSPDSPAEPVVLQFSIVNSAQSFASCLTQRHLRTIAPWEELSVYAYQPRVVHEI
jgi:hypothetical protein